MACTVSPGYLTRRLIHSHWNTELLETGIKSTQKKRSPKGFAFPIFEPFPSLQSLKETHREDAGRAIDTGCSLIYDSGSTLRFQYDIVFLL